MAEKTRTEKDSLGEVDVPADAYYGAFTQRAMENFRISGQTTHRKMIWALGVVKQAAAETNRELELLDKKDAKAIVRAAREVQKGEHDEWFVVDVYQAGAGTPMNMNANEVIANRATEILGGKLGQYKIHPNNHVNMGQSSNNVVPTAMRIALFSMLGDLAGEVQMLEEELRGKADEFKDVIKVGRTHLQDAVPIMMGQEFDAYAEYARRDWKRLENASRELLEIGLGGTAMGTHITSHPDFTETAAKYISMITKEDYYPTDSSVYLTQSTDAFLRVSGALRTLADDMLKVCDDLVLMTSGPKAGLQEIRLPEVEPGSSIMPGKVNPSIVEAYKMVCFQVLGNDSLVEHASREGQLELNVMTPVIAHSLITSIELLTNATRTFREKCVEGIEANADQLKRTFTHSLSVATALSPYIGYDMTAHLVKEALQGNKTIKQVVLNHGIIDEKDLDRILGQENLTSGEVVDRELKKKILKSDEYRELAKRIE